MCSRTTALVSAVFLLGFVGFACEATERAAGGVSGLEVRVNPKDGTFILRVDGQSWALSGLLFYTYCDCMGHQRETAGRDPRLGPYKLVILEWRTASSPTALFETHFKIFEDKSLLILGQRFPNGTSSSGPGNDQEVLSAFPAFNQKDSSTASAELHYLSYSSTFNHPQTGVWAKDTFGTGAMGGFPLILHNKSARSLVISPLNNFMVATQSFSPHLEGRFACGLLSTVQTVPKDFVQETIVVLGQGVRDTMIRWGDILLNRYGKHRMVDPDYPTRYLGYWTDNGAFYYYNTEPKVGYDKTMVDVQRYISSLRLPVQNYEFDSWWYYKDPVHQGMVLWEPMPSVFPDGMGAVDKAIGSPPLTLHNRYFAAKNYYCPNFTCIVETDKDMAMPIDERLFEYMLGKAKNWGLRVYIQDWLVTTYMTMVNPRSNVTSARQWLVSMGQAAKKLDLTILYCMALPRHILQSVEIQTVTSARASNDYQPGNSQWKIGYSSAFYHALGLYPFKDTFWSSVDLQPGCPYPKTTCTEPNSEMQTLLATLSTGPVGFSDAIGFVNTERVMRTCRMDGLLLKPDRPAMPLDAAFAAQYDPQWDGTPIELWHTTSTIADASPDGHTGFTWHYVVSADLPYEMSLAPEDVGMDVNSRHLVFDYHSLQSSLAEFDQHHHLRLVSGKTTNGTVAFNYHVIAPMLHEDWAILGEIDKFVTAANHRFSSLSIKPNGFVVELKGAEGEIVTLALGVRTSGSYFKVLSAHCPVGSEGHSTLSCDMRSSPTCECTRA